MGAEIIVAAQCLNLALALTFVVAFVTLQSSLQPGAGRKGGPSAMIRTLFRRSLAAVIVGAFIAFSFIGRTFGVGQDTGLRHFPMTSLACNYVNTAPIV